VNCPSVLLFLDNYFVAPNSLNYGNFLVLFV